MQTSNANQSDSQLEEMNGNSGCSEIFYAEFPVHSLLLSINSDYFKKIFGKCGMREELQQTDHQGKKRRREGV